MGSFRSLPLIERIIEGGFDMAPRRKVGDVISIDLQNAKFGGAQVIKTEKAGLFWFAAAAEQFDDRTDITAERFLSLTPVLFGETTETLLKRGDWRIEDWAETLVTDYRPAFRRLYSPGGVFVADVFEDRQYQVDESQILGLPNEFSRSPMGVALTIDRYTTRDDWREEDEKLLIKPEWDVKNFFD